MLYKIWWSILFPHHVHSISANRNIYSFVLDQFPFTWLLSHHSLSFVFLLLHWQYHISLPHKLLFLTWIIVTSNALSFSLLINISQSNTITSLLWLWIHYILCHLSNLYHLWTTYPISLLPTPVFSYNFGKWMIWGPTQALRKNSGVQLSFICTLLWGLREGVGNWAQFQLIIRQCFEAQFLFFLFHIAPSYSSFI